MEKTGGSEQKKRPVDAPELPPIKLPRLDDKVLVTEASMLETPPHVQMELNTLLPCTPLCLCSCGVAV